MKCALEIIKISPIQNDSVNYDILIYKLKLKGSIDLENSNDIWAIFLTFIKGGVKKILVDLSGIDFIDSAGIGVFINIAKILRSKNGDVIFTNVSPEMKKVFKVVNLQDFIKVFNLEGEAMNFFRYI